MFGIVYGSSSDNDIMNRFVDEYELWCNEGKNPDIASIDLDFALDLQKKRLDEKGVKIQTAFTDKETVKNETPVNAYTAYDMGECKSNVSSKPYEVTEKYFKDGKQKKKIKDRFFFYTMITRLENQNSNAACLCPNCGAVSSVRELLNGCKNCGTRFIMDDLFPKVTNFYFVKTYSLANKSMKKVLAPYLLGGIAAVAAFTVWVVVKDGTFDPATANMVYEIGIRAIPVVIGGLVAGYLAWAFKTLFGLFVGAAKSVPMIGPHFNCQKRLPWLMKEVNPNFSYEYFIGKVLALLKIMIFSDDYTNLAVYEGNPMKNPFGDIIDIKYRGVSRLNSFNVTNGCCYVDMTVYTTTVRNKNSSFMVKNEKFRLTVCRSVNAMDDGVFTMKKVICKSCGASFDATRERNCPYCGNPYHLGNDDWVVINFGKG